MSGVEVPMAHKFVVGAVEKIFPSAVPQTASIFFGASQEAFPPPFTPPQVQVNLPFTSVTADGEPFLQRLVVGAVYVGTPFDAQSQIALDGGESFF